AEHRHDLALIGNDHHAIGCRSDNLLAQQRATAPFDQAELVIDLIRAVHSEIEPRRLVERCERNAESFGLHPGDLGARDAQYAQASRYSLAERLDEAGGGRARPKASLHPAPHQIEPGGCAFSLELLTLKHASPRTVLKPGPSPAALYAAACAPARHV